MIGFSPLQKHVVHIVHKNNYHLPDIIAVTSSDMQFSEQPVASQQSLGEGKARTWGKSFAIKASITFCQVTQVHNPGFLHLRLARIFETEGKSLAKAKPLSVNCKRVGGRSAG